MIGYILTPKEYIEVENKFYAPYQFFNAVKDINDVWFLFLSDQDKAEISQTEWAWILDLPEGEYIPKPSPPFPYETH